MDGPHVDQERVRCLDCGATYEKPNAGGTVSRNPGCPRCSYLGWVPVVMASPDDEPPRLGAGPLQLQHGLSR